MTPRDQQRQTFIDAAGWGDAALDPLPGDASFRRYFRLLRGKETAMLMDAPPPQEDVLPFQKIARVLFRLGLSAPVIHATDTQGGFLLLEDLGDQTYTRLIAAGHSEADLYRLAGETLITLHQRFSASDHDAIPAYDDAVFLREAALLPDWLLPEITGQPTPEAIRAEYLARWQEALPLARAVPDSLVLRDYHIDNLMLLPERLGVEACGLLDFQDALIGPVTYDLVSLIEDARRDVSPAVGQEVLQRYLAAMPALDTQDFERSLAILAAQRHAKVIGIFCRLRRRDGKPVYLRHLPRLWRLLERRLDHPALAAVKDWFDETVPTAARGNIE